MAKNCQRSRKIFPNIAKISRVCVYAVLSQRERERERRKGVSLSNITSLYINMFISFTFIYQNSLIKKVTEELSACPRIKSHFSAHCVKCLYVWKLLHVHVTDVMFTWKTWNCALTAQHWIYFWQQRMATVIVTEGEGEGRRNVALFFSFSFANKEGGGRLK